jgi:signal transduction histidine kinase
MALVLVVDHRSANRAVLVRVLESAGHRALEASDGLEALETIRAEAPDLVITDILMPRMDGYEFVRHLRAEPLISQPRVAFCTATYVAGQARELAETCGVFTVIARPTAPEEMLREIATALESNVAIPEMPAEEFVRNHMRLLNHKLLEKVGELEEAHADRSRLLADLVKAHEGERVRIASDIHDDSIQVMSAAALRLEMLGDDLTESEHGEAIDHVADKVRHAVGRLRRLIFDLSPRSLESGGLGAAIEGYLREVGSEAGFLWSVDDRLPDRPADEVEAILYRIAQEAIRNAQNHARASSVTVMVGERDGGTLLRIADDGVGFAAGGAGEHRPGHVGLPSMRERARMAGGTFELETAPGAGCAIEVWVPGSPKAAAPPDRVASAAHNGQPSAP